ncbi:AtpZ/AtpI family protein [Cohaesibacter celericrescens]|uniref:ATP synthase protein I n=1 Tax=Cohaesibacter celericrescens TaxID=2067669 RepID=A0A2N5XVF1_9HYPH|nr:AtpZ/AtpI family protein [Cohaesibacter celericrescens]PLW78425.1 F0F1 ATP synthase assembly protein I [Cohaesibacter celericrescens]
MTGNKDTETPSEISVDIDDGKLDNRLGELDASLAKLRGAKATDLRQQQDNQSGASGMAMAWRLGSEFVSGVLVGGGIGWMIDAWFGLAPWGMIAFLLLGFLAGMLNMLRSAGKMPPPGA